jgi:ubiquinol-cytochrome c reductase cytochrome c1 subunit
MLKHSLTAAVLVVFALAPAFARAADASPPLPHQEWSFDGIFGTYDRTSQRGFQVYKEVCSVCHAVKHLFFRDLADLGYSEDEVKAIASTYEVTDGPNDQGQMYQRPARPSDPIPGPFPNDLAARAANNGALPPDLSMIVKAREGGPDYVFGLLNGYKDPPAGFNLLPGMNYNEYFAGHQIAMPPPLSDNAVTFADGAWPPCRKWRTTWSPS